MPADWNFFATSHGKEENKGTGGDVKNAVWRKVLLRIMKQIMVLQGIIQKCDKMFLKISFRAHCR